MKNDLIIYKDDDDTKKTVYADIIEETNSTILFRLENKNIIKLPWFRILKIKYDKTLNNSRVGIK